ncbi:MAG: PepSY domain-containing protein [Pseudomonadota bacterium]|nr:PepSY domain-containing protein [Pseudomonadota bacterium]
MRFAVLLAATAGLLAAAPAEALQGRGHGRHRDQDAAFRAMQQGQILPLGEILARVRVPEGRYIGADLDDSGSVYRLTFIRRGDVIRVYVDARTGRPLPTR